MSRPLTEAEVNTLRHEIAQGDLELSSRQIEARNKRWAFGFPLLMADRDRLQRELDEARTLLVDSQRKHNDTLGLYQLVLSERNVERERAEKAEALYEAECEASANHRQRVGELIQQIATLTEERDAAIAANVKTATLDKYADIISKENSRLETIATLREALEPFKEAWEARTVVPPTTRFSAGDIQVRIKLDHYRKAAEVIAALTPPAQEPKPSTGIGTKWTGI